MPLILQLISPSNEIDIDFECFRHYNKVIQTDQFN